MQLSRDIIFQTSIIMETIQRSLLEILNTNSKKIRESRDQNKIQHSNCGFGLCPKKYTYLANPQLLEEIFTSTKSQIAETVESTKNNQWMEPTPCQGCGEEYLLRVANPICASCRRIY